MEKQKHPQMYKKTTIILGILLLVSFGVIGYGYYRHDLAVKHNSRSEKTIDRLQNELYELNNENNNLSLELANEKITNASFKGQIESISSTVGNLKKLQETDAELLQKYSKIYFLNENYLPTKLVEINKEYIYEKNKVLKIHKEAEPFLNKMIEDSKASGMNIKILSAYRSFDEQAGLKSKYTTTFGTGANKFSADQGYSEHQLGTTLDFTSQNRGASFIGFEKTKEYEWLVSNAYKYGFILSYPKNNSFYEFEPWHWRFVGTALAKTLHEEKIDFYNLDQRKIDAYLINIFD